MFSKKYQVRLGIIISTYFPVVMNHCVCLCVYKYLSIYLSIYIYIYFFLSFRAAPIAYGSFQARGPIGAAAAGIHHGHSSGGSELHL